MGATAYVGDHLVGETDHVEAVQDAPGPLEVPADRSEIPSPRGRGTPLRRRRARRARGRPRTRSILWLERPCRTSTTRPSARSETTIAHFPSGQAHRQRCSSNPTCQTPSNDSPSTSGVPYSTTADQIVDPRHPQVSGHLRDRGSVLADPPARLSTGPFPEHPPGADLGVGLRPRPSRTPRVGTAPAVDAG